MFTYGSDFSMLLVVLPTAFDMLKNTNERFVNQRLSIHVYVKWTNSCSEHIFHSIQEAELQPF